MEQITLPFMLDLLSRGSVTVVLAVMVWLGMTRRVVTRGELEDCQRERDRLLAEEVAERERVERQLGELHADRMRIIADRDRLRKLIEDGGGGRRRASS